MAKKRVLVVDDLAIYREPIAFALEAEGYRVVCAENGCEAVRAVESNVQPFDLMIVDYSMPEMNGLSFLRIARGYPKYSEVPAIMLTDMADKEIVLQSRSLGAKDYVLKSSFSLPDLLSKVRQHSSGPASPTSYSGGIVQEGARSSDDQTSNVQLHSPPSDILFSIHKFLERNPIPQSVQKIIALAESQDSDGSVLSQAVKAEPLLATKVLRLANSSVYCRVDQRIVDIEDAVSVVGFSAIRNLAASAYICAIGLRDKSETEAHAQRSIHVYVIARMMKHFFGKSTFGSPAYLIGLCHELPETVLQQSFPAEYNSIMVKMSRQGTDFEKLVRECFGVTFTQIVEAVLNDLNLGHEIADPILLFYGRRQKAADASNRLAEALRVAHYRASQCGYVPPSLYTLNVSQSSELEQLAGRPEYQFELDSTFQSEVNEAKQLLIQNV